MLPPLIVKLLVAEDSSRPPALFNVFETVVTFTVPPLWFQVMALAVRKRLAMLSVPPSIVNVAPALAPSTFPCAVPTVNVPCVSRSRPVTVGEPACPATVKLGLLSQKPHVAGMLQVALVNVRCAPEN